MILYSFFEKLKLKSNPAASNRIPFARYRLYQYVIAINHFKDELIFCENKIAGIESEAEVITSLIRMYLFILLKKYVMKVQIFQMMSISKW